MYHRAQVAYDKNKYLVYTSDDNAKSLHLMYLNGYRV